jgi:hypothetical protein
MDISSLDDSFVLAFMDTEEARQKLGNRCDMRLIIDVSLSTGGSSDSRWSPCSLGQMYWGIRFIEDALSQTTEGLVWCVGRDREAITSCVLMLGSYLVLRRGLHSAEVESFFSSTMDLLLPYGSIDSNMRLDAYFSVSDCWRALHAAMTKGWIDFDQDEVDLDRTIDMQEYLHYDSPVNGCFHVVVPSELIALQCPADLESLRTTSDCPIDDMSSKTSKLWADIAGRRHFAPDYYAEILSKDFDVQVVVACDHAATSSADGGATDEHAERRSTYDERAFTAHGVAVERLAARRTPGAPPDGALLRDVDRFLTLARVSPGPVAIHGGPAAAGLGPSAELLATALLIHRHGLDAPAALAWLRIVHPPAAARPLSFALLPPSPAAAGASGSLPRSSSLSKRLGRLALASAQHGGSLLELLLSDEDEEEVL